jgi:predicted transcriptional regulator
MIMDSILGLERIEFEKLEQKKVEEIMNGTVPRLKADAKFKECLELLIDHPFLCVENNEGVFEGILTRRTILDKLDQYLEQSSL